MNYQIDDVVVFLCGSIGYITELTYDRLYGDTYTVKMFISGRTEVHAAVGFRPYWEDHVFKPGEEVMYSTGGLCGTISCETKHGIGCFVDFDKEKGVLVGLRNLVHTQAIWPEVKVNLEPEANAVCPTCGGAGQILMLNHYVACDCRHQTKEKNNV